MNYYQSRHQQNNRHKVFVSYHHDNDQSYKDYFKTLFADIYDTMVSKSVEDGDYHPNLKTDTIRQNIRDKNLRDSTVTVVLVGAETWKRKHVDWEIGSSIRQTQYNSRSGLLGIILPTYPGFATNTYDPHTIPPRLYDNIKCGFTKIYNWFTIGTMIQIKCNHGYMTLSNGETRTHRPTTLVIRSKTTVRAKGGMIRWTQWKSSKTLF